MTQGIIFCGGRGSNSVIKALIRQTDCDLTLIINGYDDGKSTGRIRNYVPGMLGPSDFRKNLSCILEALGEPNIAKMLEHRITIVKHNPESPDEIYKQIFPLLSFVDAKTWKRIEELIQGFFVYQSNQPQSFEFQDCAFGNLILAGAFLKYQNDFNSAVSYVQSLFLGMRLGERRIRLQNVTSGENLYLHALTETNDFINNEAEIVENESGQPIKTILLFETKLEKIDFLAKKADPIYPKANTEVLNLINESDFIIYGPGTQSSSLFPSYLTNDLLQAIAKNRDAQKLFISNLVPDLDDPKATVVERLHSLSNVLVQVSTNEKILLELHQIVTHVFSEIEVSEVELFGHKGSISCIFDHWSTNLGTHLGPAIVRQLDQILVGQLKPRPGMLSVVIPVLNEVNVLEEVLSKLFSEIRNLQIATEVIVVDGGSTDGSLSIINKFEQSTYKSIALTRAKRGEAIVKGLYYCRGDLVGVFHGDNEYDFRDFLNCVDIAVSTNSDLVIGTRNSRNMKIKEQILSVYSKDKVMGMVAFFGNMLISISCLIKLNRFITDPLSGIKIIKRSNLIRTNLKEKDLGLDLEIISICSKNGKSIVEVPVSYTARTRFEGKKTNLRSGISALNYLWIRK